MAFLWSVHSPASQFRRQDHAIASVKRALPHSLRAFDVAKIIGQTTRHFRVTGGQRARVREKEKEKEQGCEREGERERAGARQNEREEREREMNLSSPRSSPHHRVFESTLLLLLLLVLLLLLLLLLFQSLFVLLLTLSFLPPY